MRNTPPIHRRSSESGYVLLVVIFLVIVLAGLSLGLISEGMASRTSLEHHFTSLGALEAAEMGLVHAEMEIRSGVDADGNGVGNVSGAVNGSAFEVEAVADPVSTSRWVLRARGERGLSVRHVEVGIRRRSGATFADALFSKDTLVLGGGSPTDAYDSRLGTYASQVTNTDAVGNYAELGGNVGSNAGIELNGSGVRVRGDAVPGPFQEVTLSGGATVVGDRAPRDYLMSYDPPSYDEFYEAMQNNDNQSLTGGGGGGGNTVRYHAGRKTLDISGGSTLQMPAGTYFFSELTMKGNSVIDVQGPVTIYITGLMDLGAGARLLADHPGDIRIYAHPYNLPNGSLPTDTRIKINSGSQVSWALLAPEANLEIGGGNHFFGAAIVNTVAISGGNFFHYDKALGEAEGAQIGRVERLYWKETNRPPR